MSTGEFSSSHFPRREQAVLSRRRGTGFVSGAHPAVGRAPAALWGKRLVILIAAIWCASLAIGFQAALLVLTLVGFAAAIVGLRRPVIGLFGISILCTLDSISRAYLLTGGLFRWNTLNYWLLIVMLFSLPFLLHLHDPQTRLLQGLLLVLIVGLAFSSDSRTGLQDVFNIATLFGLMAYFARSAGSRDAWYWMAIVTGVLAGMGGAAFYLEREGLPEINPNAWSFFPLTALFAVALAFSVAGGRRGRYPLALLGAVNMVWVFLSGSRGSLLIGVVCLVFILLQLRKSGGALPIVATAVLVAMVVASQFISEESLAVHRLDKLFDSRYSMTGRTSGRSDLALGGWYIFREHPLLGVGTGGFGYSWMNLKTLEGISGFKEAEYAPAHSGWIKILAENGIPGFLILLAFVLSFAAIGWKRRREGLFAVGLLVTVGLSIAFLADEFQQKGLWFLAAAVMTVFLRTSDRAPRLAAHPGEGPHDLRARAASRR